MAAKRTRTYLTNCFWTVTPIYRHQKMNFHSMRVTVTKTRDRLTTHSGLTICSLNVVGSQWDKTE